MRPSSFAQLTELLMHSIVRSLYNLTIASNVLVLVTCEGPGALVAMCASVFKACDSEAHMLLRPGIVCVVRACFLISGYMVKLL